MKFLLFYIRERLYEIFCSKIFWADTIAMGIFAISSGYVIQILIAKVSHQQFIFVELVTILFSLFTARWYGKFRDWIFKKTRSENAGQFRKYLADIISFACFKIVSGIFYLTILRYSGAEWHQVLKAGIASALISILIAGRICGILIDFCRSIILHPRETLRKWQVELILLFPIPPPKTKQ